MTWEGLNRRKFPRAMFPCPVKLVAAGAAADNVFLTHTENISTGGICIILRKAMEKFTLLDVEIDLMDGQDHIICRGKVVWVVRRKATDPVKPSFYDMGIEYVDIKDEGRKRIQDLVGHLGKIDQRAKL
ncbi:MAG: PilZ domain-containing protein [Candidatus Omnitrophica bacterium]|nr:PilZ domain-containing protein [Candidatus Omnitrophota bacterium]